MTARKVKDVSFQFVVARPWYPDTANTALCIYTYHSEIQQGTMAQALNFLEYVRRQTKDKKEAKLYGIYAVGLTKIV